jgi:hypothetical protein
MYYKRSLGFIFFHFVVVDMGYWIFKGVLWSVAIEKCLGRLVELIENEIKGI